MADIKNPRLLYVKEALFVLGGLIASGLILLEHPTIKVACCSASPSGALPGPTISPSTSSSTTSIRATSSRASGRSSDTCWETSGVDHDELQSVHSYRRDPPARPGARCLRAHALNRNWNRSSLKPITPLSNTRCTTPLVWCWLGCSGCTTEAAGSTVRGGPC